MFYRYANATQPATLDFPTIIVDIHKNFNCQVDPSAAEFRRRHRRKKFGAPPRQPKFADAAAIFAARRSASNFNSLWHMQQLHYEAIK